VKHALQAIKAAPIETDPWPHFYVPQVFSPAFYREILVNLPLREQMEPLGTSTPNRFLYWLDKKGVRPVVAPFWDDLRAALLYDLWGVLEDKLEVLGRACGAELLHDLPGYRLGPHTDTVDKLVTGLIYLPETAVHAKQGTVLYHSKVPDPCGKGHKLGDPTYKPAKTIPYVPNSGFFFVRTDWSFHGVNPTPVTRWLLAFDLFNG
jgi:hypothetical protein